MKFIKIIKTGAYLPEIKIENEKLEKELQLESGYIQKRTGIQTRYYTKENQAEMAKKLIQKMFIQVNDQKSIVNDIGLIIVSTTTPTQFMPGISNIIQKELGIKTCICFDILAGCAGFINSIDIAQKYMKVSNIDKALVVGIEQLSKFLIPQDISTSIVLSDGVGAILLQKTNEPKKYYSKIEAKIDDKQMLTTQIKESQTIVEMKGKDIYKYAVTETVKNIENLLKESGETLENIKYIVPHQSNLKIIKSIISRLGNNVESKMYINIEQTGNTFCASIPIVLNEMFNKNLLNTGDKIILLGYGGGLNTGSILIEI